jgi:hypothetical protein
VFLSFFLCKSHTGGILTCKTHTHAHLHSHSHTATTITGEQAIKAYTGAIAVAKEGTDAEKVVKADCYANRAACYRQLYLDQVSFFFFFSLLLSFTLFRLILFLVLRLLRQPRRMLLSRTSTRRVYALFPFFLLHSNHVDETHAHPIILFFRTVLYQETRDDCNAALALVPTHAKAFVVNLTSIFPFSLLLNVCSLTLSCTFPFPVSIILTGNA